MKRCVGLVMLAGLMAGAMLVTNAKAQVYPVQVDPPEVESAAPTQPSLFLAEGGIQFPDGTVQATATQVILIGPALLPLTGQTVCYDASGTVIDCTTGIGPGQDGDLRYGVRWPSPRFTKNGDGTVTDNLTGLIWLEDADCLGTQNWTDALARANALFDGCSDCGGTNNDCDLADGSLLGEWRLPSVRELESLIHWGFSNPAVPDTAGTGQWSEGNPFSSVQWLFPYWSSTTYASATDYACYVNFGFGSVVNANVKSNDDYYVWPVRGGQ